MATVHDLKKQVLLQDVDDRDLQKVADKLLDLLPIALSLPLSERMQMAGWLYWRVYETRFSKRSFKDRFGIDFDCIYGTNFGLLSRLNLCRQAPDEIVLTSDGAYWLHAVQDLFSLDYVSKLWGISQVGTLAGEDSALKAERID